MIIYVSKFLSNIQTS